MKATALAALTVCALSLAHGAAAQQMPGSPEPHQVYRAPVNTSLGTAADVALGDVDGDGKVDAVVARPSGGTLHLGLGAGAFAAGAAASAATGLTAVELEDLDGDGLADLVGVRLGAAGFVRVALADVAGGFDAPADLPISVEVFFDYVVLNVDDADGDGDADVAVSVPPDSIFLESHYALYVNDGAGGLTEHAIVTNVEESTQIVPVEVNGDGLPDVLVAGWSGGSTADHVVMIGQPGGAFVEGQTFQTDFIVDHVADVDQDGDADLLLAKIGGLSVWLGQGDGTFQHHGDVSLGLNVQSIDTTDIDGDSHLDVIAFRNIMMDTLLLYGAGDGSFEVVSGVSLGPNVINTMNGPRLVDLDGDGGLDLACGLGIGGASPTLTAAPNVTYPAGGPLEDWGGARRGFGGYPVHIVTGSLVANTPVTFELEMARPNSSAWLVIGAQAVFAPFKGGLMVPSFDILSGPWPTGAAGAVDIATTWPAGLPAGSTLNLQFWLKDFAGFKGFAASGSAHLVQP